MLFHIKKISNETLGEYLAEIRQNLNLSIKDVAERLGIKVIFLRALEAGDFGKLPPDVYTIGFLKLLAPLYAIDVNLLIDQYKKERDIQRHLQENKTLTSVSKNWILQKLVVTPKSLSVLLAAVFVVATVSYIIWQVFSINRSPSLQIFEPQDHQFISDSFVNVVGKTEAGITVSINDQNIFVDSQGNFKTQLGLSGGPKDLVFVAKNKFDKAAKKTITVIGQADQPQSGQVKLRLDFLADTSVTFVLDDGQQQSANFSKGDTKMLTAKNKILISTPNAGAIHATLDNQDYGVLGRSGEQLNNIPFSAESAKIEVK